MDNIIISVAVVLAVIALIEIISLIFSIRKENIRTYTVILPIFAKDSDFPIRLETCRRSDVILVDYSATPLQKELCKKFLNDNPDAVIISKNELEKYFSETFAISEEI